MPSINQLTNDWAAARNLPVFFLSATTSTNDWAKIEFSALNAPAALYLADHQSAGRGRGQRGWTNSKPGDVWLATFCFRQAQAMQPIFTPLVGLALFAALQENWPQPTWSLKAPNDIFWQDGKLAGILVETVVRNPNVFEIYIGIGMNVFSCPKIDVCTAALSGVAEISPPSWFSFLDSFWPKLQAALAAGTRRTLSSAAIENLTAAMSTFPNNQVDKIFPDGSLQVGDELIDWRDL